MISKKGFIFHLPVTVIILLASCRNESRESKEATVKTDAQKATGKPGSSYQDTLRVSVSSAVFFQPDSVQFEKYKALNNKMVYKSVEHDCFYQIKNARTVISQNFKKIHITESRNKRIIIFVKKDGTQIFVDLDKKEVCGLFLFDINKNPQLVDMMNIDTELGKYFGEQKKH